MRRRQLNRGGPDPQFDQSGHAAAGHPEIFRFVEDLDNVFAEGEFCPSFAVESEGENEVFFEGGPHEAAQGLVDYCILLSSGAS
ncbi:MAG: hypothetical protein H0X69_10670 [Gemmatimonadales bacterium]|nr:hypothetical protein [Gemmatimonadales bacterium]